MSDLVADTDKIRTAGDLLQRMSQDYDEVCDKLPLIDALRSTGGSESDFLRQWRSLRSDLYSYAKRLVNNLNDQGAALKTVAGEHEALDEEIAADFGGALDTSYGERRRDFDAAEDTRDAHWDDRHIGYQHG